MLLHYLQTLRLKKLLLHKNIDREKNWEKVIFFFVNYCEKYLPFYVHF